MLDTYRILASARMRSDLQYRVSFVLFTLSQFTVTILDFVAILILFGAVPALAHWSLREVTFLYGLANLSFGIADLLVSPIETVQQHIQTGTFDRLLLRPASPIVQVIADQFSLRRLGKVAEGALVFGIGCRVAGIHWTTARIALTALSVVTGSVIFSGLWVLTSCVCFWWVEGREAQNALTYGGGFLAQYPLGIYGAWLRRLLAYAVPIAFVNYFPAVYVLDRHDRLGLPAWASFAAPGVALVVVIAAAMAWRVGIRHYRSTGS
jgi:ABC-2 type transport system permease protein